MRTVSPNPTWAATIQLPDDGRQIGADSQIAGLRDPINPGVEATTHRVEYALTNMEPIGHRSWRFRSIGTAMNATQIRIESRIGLDQTGMSISFPQTDVTMSGSPNGWVYCYVKRSDNSVTISSTAPDASGYYMSGGGGTDYWYVGSFFKPDNTHVYGFQYSDGQYAPFQDTGTELGFTFTSVGVVGGEGTWLQNIIARWSAQARRVWVRLECTNTAGSPQSASFSALGNNVAVKTVTVPANSTMGGTVCLVAQGGQTLWFNRPTNFVFTGYVEKYEE